MMGGYQTSYRLTITTCALVSELDKGIKAIALVQFWMVLLNKYPHFGQQYNSTFMQQDAKECSSESLDSVKTLFGIELSIMTCTLTKLVLRLKEIQPSKVEVNKAELIGIDWTFKFDKKIMQKNGSGHTVLIVQRHHFASYLEREWQCSTYDIQVANVLIGAYDKTGTMNTNQMAVAKLVAWSPRHIILLKFRVDGITYNPLDGEILNWPTGQMDANLQMIAKVVVVYNNASIEQAKQKYVAHGMPTEVAPKFLVEKMVLFEESKGAESSNGKDFLGYC
ncbi:hypothetical protein ACFX1S_019078 [Malus domestica]